MDGQEVTHFPPEASSLFVQVRQNVDDPTQVPHEEAPAGQVVLAVGSTNVPVGQLEMHEPLLRKKPGRQAVH